MASHRINEDLYVALTSGNCTLNDPGEGGSIDLKGQSLARVTIPSGTRKLKNLPASAKGTLVMIVAGGAVTIQNAAGGATLASMVSGDYVILGWNGTAWKSVSNSRGNSSTGTISIPITSLTQEDGTVLAKLNSTTSGWSQLSNKNIILNIPVNATVEAFAFSVSAPADYDINQPVYVDLFASKSADNDSLTLDCELYAVGTGGAIVSADMVSTTAQAVQDDMGEALTFTCGVPDATNAEVLSGVITVGGTNDGDAIYLHGVRIRYTKL